MIGIIGILGCVTYVCLIVGAVGAAISTGYAIDGYYEQLDHAEKMEDLENLQMKKAKKSQDYTGALKEKMEARKQAQIKSQMGSAVALNYLHAKRTKHQAARQANQNQLAMMQSSSNATLTPRPSKAFGKAAKNI